MRSKRIYDQRGGHHGLPNRQHMTLLSLSLNIVFSLWLLYIFVVDSRHGLSFGSLRQEVIRWNGGHPLDRQAGTCFCGSTDNYCMCTPSLAIDLIIVSGRDHVWLVRRKDTSQLATMGGFVMLGETVEQTVRRELKEEMTIELQDTPFLFGVYSDPRRDNRRHTVSAVYVVRLDGTEQPKAADDIKGVVRIPMDDIEKYDYFSDHKTILTDYLQIIRKKEFGKEPVSDFANDIVRSVCPIDSTAVLNTNAKSVYR